jgi:hypothetical protein
MNRFMNYLDFCTAHRKLSRVCFVLVESLSVQMCHAYLLVVQPWLGSLHVKASQQQASVLHL